MATGLLGLALVCGTGTPAVADQQPMLSLSLDGQHWAATLDRPLFDGARRWVPGDTRTVSVWVRDLAAEQAALDLRVVPEDGSWSAEDLDLTAGVDGRPVPVGQAADGRRIPLPTGSARVDLTVTMAEEAGDRAQRRASTFALGLRLDAARTDGADPTTAGAPLSGLSVPVGGRLPGSGAPPFGVPLTLVGLAVAARAALVARRSLRSRQIKEFGA